MDQRVAGNLVLIGSIAGTVSLGAPASGGNITIVLPQTIPQIGQVLTALSFANQTVTTGWSAVTQSGGPNLVLATPNGASGAATLRALVAADIPPLPYLPNTDVVPINTPAVLNQFFTAYSNINGQFTTAQPSIANVNGLSAALALKAPLASPAFSGTATFVNVGISGTLADGVSSVGTNGQVLSSTATGIQWITLTSPFSSLTTGVNTTATMTVGSGASLGFNGTGVINANQLFSVAINAAAPTTGQVLTATSASTAAWQTPSGGGGSIGSLLGGRRVGVTAVNASGMQSVWSETVNPLGSGFNSFEAATSIQSIANSVRNLAANSPAGWYGNGVNNWYFGKNLHFQSMMYLSRITDVIFITGMLGSNGPGVGGTTPAAALAGSYFRFDTTAGDTTVQCITSNGVTMTTTSTAFAPVAGHTVNYTLLTDDSVPNVKFYINGVLVATNTTNIPSGQNAGYQASLSWASAGNPLLGGTQIMIEGDI